MCKWAPTGYRLTDNFTTPTILGYVQPPWINPFSWQEKLSHHPPFVRFLDWLGFAMPAKLSMGRDLVIVVVVRYISFHKHNNTKASIFSSLKKTTTKSLSQVPTSLLIRTHPYCIKSVKGVFFFLFFSGHKWKNPCTTSLVWSLIKF
jgi:hypothetical protein